ncbi:unnamed protein product [Heligmosomoides polygyrus]|uniref:Secreted protein n=1 Tax=Heligmosomoides polygyrus TaxID=6339 RepID=A0A183FVC0_HELPZ|nr:unnamed protein product [Heligmosomoides polygyrus]
MWSKCREKMIPLPFCSDFGDDYANTADGPGNASQNGFIASAMSLDLLQDHLVSCTAHKSIFLRFSASANSKQPPYNVPTFSVATLVLLTLRDF